MALAFQFVLALAIVYGTSFLFKFIERFDFPILAVEILAGIVFGSVFGIVGKGTPGYGFLLDLAAFGLLMVMFDAGLELDVGIIRENPRQVVKLAVFTFFLPLVAGIAFGFAIGLGFFAAFLVGVTISTTSLGLVYPLLDDFGFLDRDDGQLILSVTVMNDLLSVAALSYAITLSETSEPLLGVGIVTVVIVFFFIGVPFVLDDYIADIWTREDLFANPVKIGVFVMVVLALLMEAVGIHAILGAFFGGLLLATVTHEGHQIERSLAPVSELTAPVFFFYVGMNFRVESLWSAGPLVIGGVIVLGLGTKVLGGLLGGWVAGLDRGTTIRLTSVIPGRLSISVAAAEIGRSQGLISDRLYNAFLILSVLSVFVAIVAFRYVVTEQSSSLSTFFARLRHPFRQR